MKLYLAAGEESGDLHGAHLARALKQCAPELELAGMAGPRMREAGVEAIVASEGHGVVGFIEVFGRLAKFRRDLDELAKSMAADGDAFVAIDYGGFNARLVARASRAYKDMLLRALRRAAPGARLLAFACSYHVGPELFRKIVFGASLDAGRELSVLRVLGLPADHPVSLDHPEGAYLDGLLLETRG